MRDATISSSFRAARTTRFVGLAALFIGLFAVAALVVVPRSAEAKPEYAAKEGKPCGFCHKNPAGGGDRNATGQKYEANGHTFKK
jgi:hypothetical protein